MTAHRNRYWRSRWQRGTERPETCRERAPENARLRPRDQRRGTVRERFECGEHGRDSGHRLDLQRRRERRQRRLFDAELPLGAAAHQFIEHVHVLLPGVTEQVA